MIQIFIFKIIPHHYSSQGKNTKDAFNNIQVVIMVSSSSFKYSFKLKLNEGNVFELLGICHARIYKVLFITNSSHYTKATQCISFNKKQSILQDLFKGEIKRIPYATKPVQPCTYAQNQASFITK
ncbi:unnamed protein product [Vicia faba]|uniref:Uncharacterized protein n=1 Tax=Vicia faba TaxID=3906 RepID=A0AAV1ATA0_VICFA|nr:unnamed protein product [Vicia faba]